jgi:hypothetical protein
MENKKPEKVETGYPPADKLVNDTIDECTAYYESIILKNSRTISEMNKTIAHLDDTNEILIDIFENKLNKKDEEIERLKKAFNVENIRRIILDKELMPEPMEDSGNCEWSIGEATKLAEAIVKLKEC